jgi:hypothetical protein
VYDEAAYDEAVYDEGRKPTRRCTTRAVYRRGGVRRGAYTDEAVYDEAVYDEAVYDEAEYVAVYGGLVVYRANHGAARPSAPPSTLWRIVAPPTCVWLCACVLLRLRLRLMDHGAFYVSLCVSFYVGRTMAPLSTTV